MSTNGTTSEKERYQAYLTGREWGLLKRQVKARSGGICERCKFRPSYAVHHITYARKYNERLEDLQDLCDGCHDFIHGGSNGDPIECLKAVEELAEMNRRIGIVAAFQYLLDEHAEISESWQSRLTGMIEGLSAEIEEFQEKHALQKQER